MTNPTDTYSFSRPIVGVTKDTWGDSDPSFDPANDTPVGLNDNLTVLDYHLPSRKVATIIESEWEFQAPLQNGLTLEHGGLLIDREGDAAATYVTIRGDASVTRGLRIRDNDSTDRTVVSIGSVGELTFGSSSLSPTRYFTTSNGQHSFYCGTTNIDMAINSNGLYMFGSDGVVTTGALVVQAAITKDADDIVSGHSGGVQIGHGGSTSYIANLEGGNTIAFRVGGTGSGDTVAFIDASDNTVVSKQGGFRSQSPNNSYIGLFQQGDSNLAIVNNDSIGDIAFRFGGNAVSDTVTAIDSGGHVHIGTGGSASNCAIVIGDTGESDADRLGIYRNSNRMTFTHGGTNTALIDDAGTSTTSALTLMSREKADARYVRSGQDQDVSFGAIASSGAITGSRFTGSVVGAASNPVLGMADGSHGFYVDSTSRVSAVNAGARVAIFEDTGTSLSATNSVVTREKGDGRYARSGGDDNNGMVARATGYLVGSTGNFSYKRGPINMTATRDATGSYTVTFGSSIPNPIIVITCGSNSANGGSPMIDSSSSSGFSFDTRNRDGDRVDRDVMIAVF